MPAIRAVIHGLNTRQIKIIWITTGMPVIAKSFGISLQQSELA